MRANRMITAVDAHAEGEPGRVVTGGVGRIPGRTVFEKMTYLRDRKDDLRKLLLREPRGHPALCCNILVPPGHPEADAGFVILEQTEYPPMSGSNTICVVTVLLETGIVEMVEPVTELLLESPAGLIRVLAECRDGKVTRVIFRNVPAFAIYLDRPLEVPGFGTVRVDIAWGGMMFVIAEAARFDLEINSANGSDLVRASEAMRAAAAEQLPVKHPENPAIVGPTISQLIGPPSVAGTHGTSAVTVSTGTPDATRPGAISGTLDRSPCGTGTCAKMAVLHARGALGLNQDYVNAGPLGTTFTGRLVATAKVGKFDAVVPTLAGQGWITGVAQYTVDPTDPFPEGYTISDIWG